VRAITDDWRKSDDNLRMDHSSFLAEALVGIPVKVNDVSGGKANGIPERR
jgi:hypothetical protein